MSDRLDVLIPVRPGILPPTPFDDEALFVAFQCWVENQPERFAICLRQVLQFFVLILSRSVVVSRKLFEVCKSEVITRDYVFWGDADEIQAR